MLASKRGRTSQGFVFSDCLVIYIFFSFTARTYFSFVRFQEFCTYLRYIVVAMKKKMEKEKKNNNDQAKRQRQGQEEDNARWKDVRKKTNISLTSSKFRKWECQRVTYLIAQDYLMTALLWNFESFPENFLLIVLLSQSFREKEESLFLCSMSLH